METCLGKGRHIMVPGVHLSSVKFSLPLGREGVYSPICFKASTIPLTARQTSVWELSGFSLTEQAAFSSYSSICGPQVQPTIISFFESCNVVFRRNIPALPFELPGQRFFPTSVPCKEYFGKMNHTWYSAPMTPAGSDGRSPGRFGLDS